MSEEKIVLGEYELIGKNRSGETVELVFKPCDFTSSPLEAMRFARGERSSIVIRDRTLAKRFSDDERFRIVLERVSD
jgi:hypothetical protein